MVSNRIVVSVVWGPRQESLEDCAWRLRDCLQRLRNIHSAFADWKQAQGTRREAEKYRVLPTMDSVVRVLRSGMNHYEEDGKVIAELGFSFGLWNTLTPGASVKLHGACGVHSRSTIRNRVDLRLPTRGQVRQELTRGPVLKLLLKTMVAAWAPEWGCVSSAALVDAAFPGGADSNTGWIIYTHLRQALPPGHCSKPPIELIGSDGAIFDLLDQGYPEINLELIDAVRKAGRLAKSL